jgi:hypothetical protein
MSAQRTPQAERRTLAATRSLTLMSTDKRAM